jgi:Ni/Co efflux regulator RcnB
MKRLALSAIAASVLAASALPGFAASATAPVAPHSAYTQVDWKKPHHDGKKSHRDVKKQTIKKKKVQRHHWRHGQKYSNWRKHERVDWRRHHLRRPGPGQEWVRVGNDYILVSVLTGIIAGFVAAH